MGLAVVKVAAGGLPVTIAASGGLPCTEATNGYGIAVTEATGGGGLAVTGFAFGPTSALSASSVLETAAVNTTVGTLSVTGSYTGTPVFTLADSAGGKFNISGTTLRTNALLDYETATFHVITVAVSGTTPAVANKSFTILVTDVAEPVIVLTGTTVNEDAAVNTTVGTLSIVNAYTGTPTYTLADSAGGKFNISGALLRVNAALDYETATSHSVTVSVSGITPAAANKAFTIAVLDVVEAAPSAKWSGTTQHGGVTLTNSDLTAEGTNSGTGWNNIIATVGKSSGKYYCEFRFTNITTGPWCAVGFSTNSFAGQNTGIGLGGNDFQSFGAAMNGDAYRNGVNTVGILPTYAVNQWMAMALDIDNKLVWFKNITTGSTWNNVGGDPDAGTGGISTSGTASYLVPYYPAATLGHNETGDICTINCGPTYAGTKPSLFSNWGAATSTTTKNIVTDYSCPTNGTSNCRPAFLAFRDAMQGQNVILTIPAGTYNFHATAINDEIFLFKGISNLVVEGTGATIADNGGVGVTHLGGIGQIADNQHSTRIASVSAGATTVTVTPAAASQPGGAARDTVAECCAMFTVGQWALITGFDLQGFYGVPYGQPTNPHFFEFVKITNINSTTGVITFEAPLEHTYLSTWPNFNSGNSGEPDNGGPATLYAYDPSWNMVAEYRGLTFTHAIAQIYAIGRSITYRNCTFTGTGGAIPTQNQLWQTIDCNMALCRMEVDKIVQYMAMTRTDIDTIIFQSSSTDLLDMDDCDVTVDFIGTPKRTIIANSRLETFRPGPYAHGRADELTITNSVINSFAMDGITSLIEKGPADAGINTGGITMSGGIIYIPNSIQDGTYGVNFCRAFIPGTNLFWANVSGWVDKLFRVIAVTQNATHCLIQTSEAGTFPIPADGGGKLFVRVHPAPFCTITGCTGTDGVAASLSQAPAGLPLFSYQKYTYPGSIGTTEQRKFIIWGNLSSVSLNVTTAYVGASAPTFFPGNGWIINNSAGASSSSWTPVVNAKIAGNRVITLGGVTDTQSLDTGLTVPDATRHWFAFRQAFGGPQYSVNTSAGAPAPSITVTFQTDQGVVIP